jgi:hypothetical protein
MHNGALVRYHSYVAPEPQHHQYKHSIHPHVATSVILALQVLFDFFNDMHRVSNSIALASTFITDHNSDCYLNLCSSLYENKKYENNKVDSDESGTSGTQCLWVVFQSDGAALLIQQLDRCRY